jgi:hypothetical protein
MTRSVQLSQIFHHAQGLPPPSGKLVGLQGRVPEWLASTLNDFVGTTQAATRLTALNEKVMSDGVATEQELTGIGAEIRDLRARGELGPKHLALGMSGLEAMMLTHALSPRNNNNSRAGNNLVFLGNLMLGGLRQRIDDSNKT